jgi:uncharacterized membrane protein YeaQ/YmgE (transglycosylase-associated protein family)
MRVPGVAAATIAMCHTPHDILPRTGRQVMDIVWAVVVGFFAGIIAKLVTPGGPKPRGFILTTVLGIVGALLATWLGQAIHLYGPGDTANFVGQIIGAIIVLLIWRQLARPR